MEEAYVNSLSEQLLLECSVYGQGIVINGNKINALVSTSPTTKSLQVAGFFKNQTLDIIAPLYSETPKINHIVVYRTKTYVVKQVEEVEYSTGHRLVIELVR